MPIKDVDTPFSDGWWLRRLLTGMNAKPMPVNPVVRDSRRTQFGRRDWLDLLWSYNVGEAPLPHVSQHHRQATREFLRMARANYGQLAAEALADRVQLVGVRTDQDQDADGDDVVRAMIEANGAWLQDTLAYTFSMGTGFVMIGPGAEDGTALMTAEDPRQVFVASDPTNPAVARAGVKVYRDDDYRLDVALLFRPADSDGPDRLRCAVRNGAGMLGSRFTASSWEWDDDPERSGPLKVQGFGVPIVPFTNRFGLGEYEPHLDLLDRINNMIADRMWTAKLQAFRQRALKASAADTPPISEVDAQGNEVDLAKIFEADPGALWEMPVGWEVWESQVVDLTPILVSVRDDVREFSAVTRTPLSMFSPDGANQTAEGAKNADDGLVFKAEDRTTRLTPAALRAYRLALAYAGHEDRARGPLQAIWAPSRRLTLEQRGQAAVQAKTSGVPQESIYSEVWQFPPATVARMMKQRRADAAAALFTQPPAAVTPPVTTDG